MIFTLLTLAFIIAVATIVGLMVTAVQMASESTTIPKSTTTMTTFSTTDATTRTSFMTSTTTAISLSTTTTNLDEWLCDNWVCDWKGESLLETLTNVASEELCWDACQLNPDCVFYSFISVRGELSCYLLASCDSPSYMPNCQVCGSGPKNCSK